MQLAVERPQAREVLGGERPRDLFAGGFATQVEESQRPQGARAIAARGLAPRLELAVRTRIELSWFFDP